MNIMQRGDDIYYLLALVALRGLESMEMSKLLLFPALGTYEADLGPYRRVFTTTDINNEIDR